MRTCWLILCLSLTAGCRLSVPVGIAERLGERGWFEIEGPYQAKTLLERSESESAQLDMTALGCDELLHERQGRREVFVLTPGIQGAGPEWEPVVERMRQPGRRLFFFRWVPLDTLETLSADMATGLQSLVGCLNEEGDALTLLSHSAGGIIAAHAVARIGVTSPAPPTLRLFTAATALAGFQLRSPTETDEEDGQPPVEDDEGRFLLELGGAFRDYAPAGPGVEVFHLRTQLPGDPVMRPLVDGKLPNDPSIGVPGAFQVDLPNDVGHDPSLLLATEHLEDGTWVDWRDWPRLPALNP